MGTIKVAKFGGTSVGTLESILQCSQIVKKDPQIRCVVVSAQSGVTDLLVKLADASGVEQRARGLEEIKIRMSILLEPMNVLPVGLTCQKKLTQWLDKLEALVTQLPDELSKWERYKVLSMGEAISSEIVAQIFESCGIKTRVLNATDLIKVRNISNTEIKTDQEATRISCQDQIQCNADDPLVVTQGFIGTDLNSGKLVTLGRGGSDFSAALIAEALDADELQLWTDVEGIYTVDPREVDDATPLPELSFELAGLMARFGAKVLHPETISPVMRNNIPSLIASTNKPNGKRTWIRSSLDKDGPIAITRRKNQALLTAKVSTQALKIDPEILYQQLTKALVLSDWSAFTDNTLTAVIDLPTSNIPSLTLDRLQQQLKPIAEVTIEKQLNLVTVVGNKLSKDYALKHKLFKFLEHYPVRNLMMGTSDHTVSWLIPENYTHRMLNELNQLLFSTEDNLEVAV